MTLTWSGATLPNALFWQRYKPAGSPWDGDVFAIEPSSTVGRTWTEALHSGELTRIEDGSTGSTWAKLAIDS